MEGLIFGIVIIIILIILAIRCICIVPQASAWIVEALGQYRATWGAGLHFKVPIIHRGTGRGLRTAARYHEG